MYSEYSKDSIMASERRKDEIALADEYRLHKLERGAKKPSMMVVNFLKAYHWVAHALRHIRRHTAAPISHAKAVAHLHHFMHRNHRRHTGFQTAR